MKSIDNSQTDNHTIRMKSTFSEDRIKIIKYPTFHLITWNLSTITKRMLGNILGEDYDDLLIMLTLYRKSKQQHFTDFNIHDSSGVLRLFNLPTGTYYCEIVGCNSRNETITVKRSNTVHYVQTENKACTEFYWEERPNEKVAWMQAYSGYTVYE
jgi:hypothetical protein